MNYMHLFDSTYAFNASIGVVQNCGSSIEPDSHSRSGTLKSYLFLFMSNYYYSVFLYSKQNITYAYCCMTRAHAKGSQNLAQH